MFNINENIKSKQMNTYLCSRSIFLFLSSSINYLLTFQVLLVTFLGRMTPSLGNTDIH